MPYGRLSKGTIILCNGLTPETALKALNAGFADLVAFGRSFLANPDLDNRIATGASLNQPDFNTLYTPGQWATLTMLLYEKNKL